MGCEASDVGKTKVELASKGTGSSALQPDTPHPMPPSKVSRLGSKSPKGRAEGPPLPTAAAPKARGRKEPLV